MFEPMKSRFEEPAKFLPVAFIVINITMLWSIYNVYHISPLLQEAETAGQGTLLAVVFNCVAFMIAICYARSILTQPGVIPDTAEWEYVPQDTRDADSSRLDAAQETKRSGDRRHCKWCAKYKPDRCHHCRVCRTCVLRMDHHCPWIYNCVGFANHKYFFLVLFYSVIACQMIIWTMYSSLKMAVTPETDFLSMFLLLFGETLAIFLGFMVTVFFGFHIWLMLKAMTTIEFCEKSMKRSAYDTNAYNRGLYGNIRAVLGDQPLLWLLPCSPPSGDGIGYVNEEAPLLQSISKDMEDGRGIRKKVHENAAGKHKGKKSYEAGTGGSTGSDYGSGQESDSAPESAAVKSA